MVGIPVFVGHVHQYWLTYGSFYLWMCVGRLSANTFVFYSVWLLALEMLVWTDFCCHTWCASVLADKLMGPYLCWLQGLALCVPWPQWVYPPTPCSPPRDGSKSTPDFPLHSYANRVTSYQDVPLMWLTLKQTHIILHITANNNTKLLFFLHYTYKIILQFLFFIVLALHGRREDMIWV